MSYCPCATRLNRPYAGCYNHRGRPSILFVRRFHRFAHIIRVKKIKEFLLSNFILPFLVS